METHFDFSDSDFLAHFNTCELDPTLFSHEAHLRLAYLNIKKHGPTEAEQVIQEQLKRYVAHQGAQDKYNTTLTLAACKAVQHFMAKATAADFTGFITEFPRLKHNFKDLMSAHYSMDIYSSASAKSEFLAPDLLPFN